MVKRIFRGLYIGATVFILYTLVQMLWLNPSSYLMKDLPKIDFEINEFPPNESAVVKIGRKGKAFCTAFVISNNYLMTAAHCLRGQIGKSLEIFREDGTDTKVLGKTAGYNDRIDVGIILGDFHNFTKVPVNFYSSETKIPLTGSDLSASCGYPYGQNKLVCINVLLVDNYGFSYLAKGLLIPGMSGGPLFSSQGKAIGVNSAAIYGGILFAPIAGSLAYFGLE